MQSPREALEFLENSLRSLDADTLASMAESLAQQAHEAAALHPDRPEFSRLEERFLDIAVRHAESGREFARQARLLGGDNRVVMIEGAGHYPQIEQPDATCRAILEHLAEHGNSERMRQNAKTRLRDIEEFSRQNQPK